jgi:cytochrome c oxidase cbb3-type subunit 3
MTPLRLALAALVVVVVLVGGATWFVLVGRQTENRISVNYPEGVAAAVPLGISVGQAPTLSVSTANPLAGDPTAAQSGKQFFRSLNCAGCHGYGGKGGIGPDLTDAGWRYGGTPIQIYKSIYEGRPKGMPAWGNTLPPTTVWRLVSYIQSLGRAPPAPVTAAAAAQSKSPTQ